MSQPITQNQKSIFKFSLQEEKFNQIKNFPFSSNPLIQIGENFHVSRRCRDESVKDDVKSKSIINSHNDMCKSTIRHIQYNDDDYIKFTIDKFKNEISELKSYIFRLNKEIRKKLEIEIPILDDLQLKIHPESDPNEKFSEVLKYFKESFERLLNPDYLNPIFSYYDSNINEIENELNLHKNLSSKYETRINELTKENTKLRESLLIKSNEMKELLKSKIENNSVIPMDEEFFRFLEERNNLLSKENEILAVNYQKVSKELFDFSLNYSEKHKESLQKIEIYDKLETEFKKLTVILEDIMTKNKIYERKFSELTEELTRIEIEKNNYKILCDKFRSDNDNLTEANSFYKNFIEKNVKN